MAFWNCARRGYAQSQEIIRAGKHLQDHPVQPLTESHHGGKFHTVNCLLFSFFNTSSGWWLQPSLGSLFLVS